MSFACGNASFRDPDFTGDIDFMSTTVLQSIDLRKFFGVPAYDLAARDKIQIIKTLMPSEKTGLALDIGIGTGYTTYNLLGNRHTVCVDLHSPNLSFYRSALAKMGTDADTALCVTSPATVLPFRDGEFKFILCSEVLEHLVDDATAMAEISRVMAPDGRLIVTVPYTGWGFTSFLELFGIKTVHDFPGPEQHVRPGYDEKTMGALLSECGLEIEEHTYFLRFFTRIAVDMVSLSHILYQRLVNGRKSWTWSEATDAESGAAFKLYKLLFPVMAAFAGLDRLLLKRRSGFGLIVSARKKIG